MKIAALCLLLVGCGDLTVAPSDLPPPLDFATPADLPPDEPSTGVVGESGYDPCQYALCEGPLNKRIEYSDPARTETRQ